MGCWRALQWRRRHPPACPSWRTSTPGSICRPWRCMASCRERQRAAYGLEDDCAPFPGLYEHAALTAGGSLQAAAALCSGAARLAVHLDGGRHHARKARASGICFVNDVVLAILQLLAGFHRVLYLDLDVHHGDGVEEAFEMDQQGAHPFAAQAGARLLPRQRRIRGARAGLRPRLRSQPASGGRTAGRPFPAGFCRAGWRGGRRIQPQLCGAAMVGASLAVWERRRRCPQEQCQGDMRAPPSGPLPAAAQPMPLHRRVPLCSGVDGLARDPLAGSWALTPRAYAAAAATAASWGRPLLLLGGGGYDSPSAAVAWAGVLAELVGKAPLPDDIPEHEHFERYGPGFTRMSVTKRLLPADTTNPATVMRDCDMLLAKLRSAAERCCEGSSSAAGGRQSALEERARQQSSKKK
ncbi:hypothetical protein ABPG77_010095 [Micractinium sp. CCAP 211/92]